MSVSRNKLDIPIKYDLEDENIIHTVGRRSAFSEGNRDGLLNRQSSENKREYSEAHAICMTRRKGVKSQKT